MNGKVTSVPCFATRQTAKEYKMMYFKGENGKSLEKQKL